MPNFADKYLNIKTHLNVHAKYFDFNRRFTLNSIIQLNAPKRLIFHIKLAFEFHAKFHSTFAAAVGVKGTLSPSLLTLSITVPLVF